MREGKLKWHVFNNVQTAELEDTIQDASDAHSGIEIFDVVYVGNNKWTVIVCEWLPIGSAKDFMRAVEGVPGVVLEMKQNDGD